MKKKYDNIVSIFSDKEKKEFFSMNNVEKNKAAKKPIKFKSKNTETENNDYFQYNNYKIGYRYYKSTL